MGKKFKTVERTSKGVVVRQKNAPYTIDYGATCVNPDAKQEDRIYEKLFVHKPIYLAGDYDKLLQDRLSEPDTFVLTMNGYSSLKEDVLQQYRITVGAYEQACRAIMNTAIRLVQGKFPGAKLVVTYGASDMGVDRGIHLAAKQDHNLDLIGFSCPEYMLYVQDDKVPVYVANDSDHYADQYIRTSDFLICTGGREQALKHDVYAACIYNKHIHIVDVLSNLSQVGSVPATRTEEDGSTRVENAAAAFGTNITYFDKSSALLPIGDAWDAIFENVGSEVTKVCRNKLSPEKMFGR